ncbi:MAG: ABC transporter permease [Culicoidibacterales bacterium]
MKIVKKKYLIIILSILSIISILIGVNDLNIAQIFTAESQTMKILLFIRFPRLITVILTAVGLSISGLIMQQLSQNKFVSPSTGTTVDAAKLGILVAILFFPGNWVAKIIIAFFLSLISTIIFLLFIRKIKVKNVIFIPLMGLMLGGIIDSVTTFIAVSTDQVQNINSWMQGSVTGVIKGNYEILYLIVPLVIIAFVFANKFTIAGMGEDFSINLGMNYQLIINIGLAIVALITSTIIIGIGSIPFLGLIIPNIVSLYRGDNIKHSLWETALLGAIFLLTCDIISRIVIYPYEVPISLIVGIVGSIIFIYLIYRKNARQ